ncbi:hypothetical protein [Micromonospora sp. NPDC093277]|uniref:hypothetical protein n=1 Tax=Micromonospora sp. NPDC093277 TaxID=3364291 RepID=UPI0037F1FCD1
MRKTTAVLSLAAALSLTPVAAAPAAANEAGTRLPAVEATPTSNQDKNYDSGNKGLNGLWGLIGLGGLLGLLRRPKVQQPPHRPEPRGDVPRNPRT